MTARPSMIRPEARRLRGAWWPRSEQNRDPRTPEGSDEKGRSHRQRPPGHRSWWWFRIAVSLTVGTLSVGTGLIVAAPAGAERATTGPTATPERFASQKPVWHRCGPEVNAALECAAVKVPLDYQHPRSPTIDIAVSRLRSKVPAQRRGILLFNPGGPGVSGRWVPRALPQGIRDQFDVVGFDPRGVGASSPITCGLTDEDRAWFQPYQPETFAKDVARARTVAAKCATDTRIPYITTRNTARDMDVIRAVLGEQKLSYLGLSYGTYLGATYLQLFPNRVDRIVLDSALDPALVWRGAIQAWAVGSKSAFARWTTWTAQRDAEYGLGETASAVSQTFWDLVARADRKPIETPDRTYTGDEIRISSTFDAYFVREQAATISRLKKAADGQPTDLDAASKAESRTGFADGTEPPTDNADAVFLAITCNDATDWPRDPEQYRRDAIRDQRRYPLVGDVTSNISPCAFWSAPHLENAPAVHNSAAGLIVQNEWDPQTPSFMARNLHRALAGSRLVLVDEGEGHIVYTENGNTCAIDAVNDYLSTGALPDQDVTCKVDPVSPDAAPTQPSVTSPTAANRVRPAGGEPARWMAESRPASE